jgi:hypothetical protein
MFDIIIIKSSMKQRKSIVIISVFHSKRNPKNKYKKGNVLIWCDEYSKILETLSGIKEYDVEFREKIKLNVNGSHGSREDTGLTEDMKLICKYHVRTDNEYKEFEKNVLLKHNRLCDYVTVDNDTAIFTFDFSDLAEDWDHFINGRYSKLSNKTKDTIKTNTQNNFILLYF